MAEFEINKQKERVKRFHKKSARVDLTPMVDLGFLLLSFFVFTTTLSQPTTMQLNMPYDKTKDTDPVCESCVLTVLLDKNNSIKYFEGAPENNPPVYETGYAPEGIRKILTEKRKAVKIARGRSEAFILIIKPSNASSFQNFVDIIDEATINNIKRYYIDELNQADQKLLDKK